MKQMFLGSKFQFFAHEVMPGGVKGLFGSMASWMRACPIRSSEGPGRRSAPVVLSKRDSVSHRSELRAG